jgi:hypothetical protein
MVAHSKFRIRDNAPFLQLGTTTTPEQCRQLIRTATKDQIETLCEIAKNVRLGNIRIPRDHLRKLRRYRPVVNKLTEKRVSWKKKKRALQQFGGVFPLLALLAPAIGGVLGVLTEKLVKKVTG